MLRFQHADHRLDSDKKWICNSALIPDDYAMGPEHDMNFHSSSYINITLLL